MINLLVFNVFVQPGLAIQTGKQFNVDTSGSFIKPSASLPLSVIATTVPAAAPRKGLSNPIIMVPAAGKTLLTLYNIKKFLEEGWKFYYNH